MSLAEGWVGRIGIAQRRIAQGVDTTIEDAGYRGVPNPEIPCSDRHLAAAEDISLGLSLCDCQDLNEFGCLSIILLGRATR